MPGRGQGRRAALLDARQRKLHARVVRKARDLNTAADKLNAALAPPPNALQRAFDAASDGGDSDEEEEAEAPPAALPPKRARERAPLRGARLGDGQEKARGAAAAAAAAAATAAAKVLRAARARKSTQKRLRIVQAAAAAAVAAEMSEMSDAEAANAEAAPLPPAWHARFARAVHIIEDFTAEDCAICKMALAFPSAAARCRHVFHARCLSYWCCKGRFCCPLCKCRLK